MVIGSLKGIKIEGIAAAVPGRVVKTESYAGQFGAQVVDKFIEMSGILEKRVCRPEQTASDLCFVAAEQLIRAKAVEKSEIGLLVFVSQTSDYVLPATACVLQQRLGLSEDCLAFDINMGCSGYLYGIQTAASVLATITARYALVVVGETAERLMSAEDSGIMLFGDAGSATLLSKGGEDSLYYTAKTDGGGFKTIIYPAGGFRNPVGARENVPWHDGNKRSDYNTYMDGTEVFNFTIRKVPLLIKAFLEKIGQDQDEIDQFVLHQANAFILKQVARKAKIPSEKLPISIDRFGNSSCATIPVTLVDACERWGKVSRKVLMVAFGVGLSWGALLTDLGPDVCLPMIVTDDYFRDGNVEHFPEETESMGERE